LISDDGSTDNSFDIISIYKENTSHKIKVFKNDFQNIALNCNFLAEKSSGKYLKFLFQDDYLYDSNLEEFYNSQKGKENVGLIFSQRFVKLENNSSEICRQIHDGCRDLHNHWSKIKNFQKGIILFEDKNFLTSPLNKIGEPSNTLILREAFFKVGGFDHKFSQLVDLDLWFKIIVLYNVVFIDKKLSIFRLHSNQASVRNIKENNINSEIRLLFKKLITNKHFYLVSESVKGCVVDYLESAYGQNLILKHNEQINVLRNDFENKFNSTIFDYRNTLTATCEKYDLKIKELNNKNLDEINKIQKIHAKDIKLLQLQHNKESLSIRKHYEDIIHNLNQKIIFFKDKLHFIRNTFTWKIRHFCVVNIYNRINLKKSKLYNSEELIKDHSDYSNTTLKFKQFSDPYVSIIIPFYNNPEITNKCLTSILKNTSKDISYEIVLVDDCSTENISLISRVQGVRVYRNKSNIGFLKSCNKGILHSSGQVLVFLNNDTEVQLNWLDNIISTFRIHDNVGIVGSKLVYPNGVLQEAGGLIWSDASGCNYGRGLNPQFPEFNYLREVDYVSGACLAILKTILNDVNYFSEEFAPAYYEDTDLCFKVRQLGKKVLYQPNSVVIHHEGISCGTDESTGVKSFQKINRIKFYSKWKKILKTHSSVLSDDNSKYLYNLRFKKDNIILIIDSYIPRYDRESGSRRIYEIIKILISFDMHVIFLPSNLFAEEPYYTKLTSLGVEVLAPKDWSLSVEQLLKNKISHIKYAWICRPEIFKQYFKIFRKRKIIVFYDSIDLHHLRIKREWELGERKSLKLFIKWRKLYSMEKSAAQKASKVFSVTKNEADFFRKHNSSSYVIPNVHTIAKHKHLSFEERRGILFIGSYNHTPNVDAVFYLYKEIMPLIWKEKPNIKLTLLGSDPPSQVLSLQSDNIFVPGYVDDVSSYFSESRVFVSPLRYGAGMKGKIGQSMSYGLPVVMTEISAEGMSIKHSETGLIANEPQCFAKNILKLYSNQELWKSISRNSQQYLQRYSPETISLVLKDILF
jgi:GT2 family glycosyltransferase